MSSYITAINFIAIIVFLTVVILPILAAVSLIRGRIRKGDSTARAFVMITEQFGLSDLVASVDKGGSTRSFDSPGDKFSQYIIVLYATTLFLSISIIEPSNIAEFLLPQVFLLWNFASWFPIEISLLGLVVVFLYVVIQREGFTV